MGKSRTSGISKTGSSIGIGGGGAIVSGANAGVQAQSNPPSTSTDAQDLIDASKIASPYGNKTSAMFASMTDDQMAQAVKDSRKVDMPNHIADRPDATQKFVFANQLNAKPTVLSDSDFDDYVKMNKIGKNEYLLREVDPVSFKSNGIQYNYSADDVTDMFKTSDINYIGGKYGGQVYGAGSYFAMGDFNHRTNYGSGADGVGHKTIVAVFDKSKARVISYRDIGGEWAKFSKSNPRTASAVGGLSTKNSDSIKALLMGYNVITSDSTGSITGRKNTYYNVIDRSALVVRASNRR